MNSATDWPFIPQSFNRTRSIGVDLKPPFKLAWNYHRKSGSYIDRQPVSKGDQFACVTWLGAIDAFGDDGELRWQFKVPRGKKRMPVFHDGIRHVLLVTDDGVLIVVREGWLHGYDWKNGEQLWEIPETTGGFEKSIGRPDHDFCRAILGVDSKGKVAIGSSWGTVIKISPQTGHVVSRTETGSTSLVSVGNLLVGCNEQASTASELVHIILDIDTLRFRRELSRSMFPQVPWNAIRTDDRIIAISRAPICYNLELGQQLWSIDRSLCPYDGLNYAANDQLLFANNKKEIVAFDLRDGSVVWKSQAANKDEYYPDDSMLATPNYVYAFFWKWRKGSLRVFSAKDGKMVWESEDFQIEPEERGCPGLMTCNGKLIFKTEKSIRCFAPQS